MSMPEQKSNPVDAALEGVSPSRRAFLRNLLVTGALALPASHLLADDASAACQGGGGSGGKGKGKGGKGKGGKGKGKGKGDGNGNN